ncbi:unnamed protein product [Ectocarpus sp. CCAP 1310/34]|nr:unnamed protein product [Ectocarpus sp. CCAP 1310/34]
MSGGVSEQELAAKLGDVARALTERFEEKQARAEARMEQPLGTFEGLLLQQPTRDGGGRGSHGAVVDGGAVGGAVGIPGGTGRGSAAGNLLETVGPGARDSGGVSGGVAGGTTPEPVDRGKRRSWDNLKAGFQQPGYATLNWTLSDWNGAVTERVEMIEVQEMMGMLPSLLQAESEGQGQEGSAALQEGAAGAAELGVPPSSHRELYPAVVVREGDTAGGERSSGPGVEGALVRDVEVPAAGGFGAFQDTNSLRSTFGSACVQQSAAAGETGESVTATDQSIQGRSGGGCGTAEGSCPLLILAVVAGGAHRSRRN